MCDMLKTIILIGGPSKGTLFRPLSLDVPQPLFPVAGFPVIYHHIEAASQVTNMKEIILIGSYQLTRQLSRFITSMQQEFKIIVRYLQEFSSLGTAGGMYHFRDQILTGNPELFFVMNADVCGDFPLQEMLDFHLSIDTSPHFTILATEATRQQSLNYGCIVENKLNHQVTHFVEKPSTFVSTLISCGIYLFCPELFDHIATVFRRNQDDVTFDVDSSAVYNRAVIRLEQDIFAHELSASGKLYVYQTTRFWSQIKSAGATIYANRHYLNIYHRTHTDRLAANADDKPTIIGDVFIHPQATVHPTATLGPNVTIGKNVVVHEGVRVRESIILDGAVVQEHSCILYSILGWKSIVGPWTRIEGTPNDPNPNKPFAKVEVADLFKPNGCLSPSITIIGSNVQIPGEVIVLNSIVLPDKELDSSYKNQIIL
jgi:mannose-1-phosphate guanylyltransferase